MNSREAEIQKHLAMLYDQQKAFSSPTPADDPAEYEVEELEAWEKGTRTATVSEESSWIALVQHWLVADKLKASLRAPQLCQDEFVRTGRPLLS